MTGRYVSHNDGAAGSVIVYIVSPNVTSFAGLVRYSCAHLTVSHGRPVLTIAFIQAVIAFDQRVRTAWSLRATLHSDHESADGKVKAGSDTVDTVDTAVVCRASTQTQRP